MLQKDSSKRKDSLVTEQLHLPVNSSVLASDTEILCGNGQVVPANISRSSALFSGPECEAEGLVTQCVPRVINGCLCEV